MIVDRKLEGWVLAIIGGVQVIGVAHGAARLEPVYQYQASLGQTQDGRVVVMRAAFPLGLVPSITKWQGAVSVIAQLSELAAAERDEFVAAIHGAEQVREKIISGRSNLVIARPQ